MQKEGLYDNLLNEKEKQEILGKKQTKLFYQFGEFEYSTQSKERILSGIKQLDYLIKGFELGCVTIWTGFTNAGKTTVLTMIAKQTIKQHEKIFFFNGEQTKEEFKNNLYKQSVQDKNIFKRQYRNSNVFDYFVDDNISVKLEQYYADKIIVFNNEMKRDINTLLYAMEEVRKKYGVRVFFLDNFMQIDVRTDNVYQEQTDIMEKLRTFAVNKNVHIHLVAHPRKTERFQVRLNLFDIAGSSNLINKAYNIISIIRVDKINRESKEYQKLTQEMLDEKYNLLETSTVLEVLKQKGNRDGLVGLQFDELTKSFKEQEMLTSEKLEKLNRTLV